jgi:hypothetical protein
MVHMAAIPESMGTIRRPATSRAGVGVGMGLGVGVGARNARPAQGGPVGTSDRPRLRLLAGGAGAGAIITAAGPTFTGGELAAARARPPAAAARRRARARTSQLLAAVLTVGGLAGLWIGAGVLRDAGGAPAPLRLAGTTPVAGGYRYVVRQGDSLWSIAARVQPAGDPRQLVDELGAQLHGATLQPGDVLVLP